MSGKVNVLPDENLGGVLREYVEVDREAEVGDLIKVVKACDPDQYDEGGIYKVRQVSEHIRIDSKYGGTVFMYDDEYVVIEPTDIVHIDGVRYRLVDRKAKVGEKVIIVESDDIEIGTIGNCIVDSELADGSIDIDVPSEDTDYTFIDTNFDKYYVLEPVDPAQTAEPEPIEVDTRHTSPEVIDMLANLARRVTELELKLDGIVDLKRKEYDAYEKLFTGIDEKIEMLIDDVAMLDERTQPLVALVKAVKSDE
jgi:hypothetical protein